MELKEHRKCSDALNEATEVFNVYQIIAELGTEHDKSLTLSQKLTLMLFRFLLFTMMTQDFPLLDDKLKNNR